MPTYSKHTMLHEVCSTCMHPCGISAAIYSLPAGGPGFEAPRPIESSSWVKSAVGHFKVLLMDQRGTGRSSPVTVANVSAKGSAAEQVEHLKCFRQDWLAHCSGCTKHCAWRLLYLLVNATRSIRHKCSACRVSQL